MPLTKYTTLYALGYEVLERKANINAVRDRLALIRSIQTEAYWKEISLPALEYIREQLRDLMRLLEGEDQRTVYTDLADQVEVGTATELPYLPKAPDAYLAKVKSFIRKHQDYLVIHKITHN